MAVFTMTRTQAARRRCKGNAEERFRQKYEVGANGCWIWQAGVVPPNPKRKFPYGNFFWHGRNGYAHRFAYELVHGPIPTGLTIDHLCRNTLCVNHQHLEAVTIGENVRRGIHNRKTHCLRGHSFTAENTRLRNNGRRCKACERLRYSQRAEVPA